MAFTSFAGIPIKASAANAHSHKICIGSVCGDTSVAGDNICGHGEETWEPWGYTSSGRPVQKTYYTDGTYYLTGDITLDSNTTPITISKGQTLNLCLNGHTITMAVSGRAIFTVENGGTLNLCDCQGGGTLTGATALSNNGAVTARGTFCMYGGRITGNKAGSSSSSTPGGVYISNYDTSAFYMYGGEISGNEGSQGGGILCSANFNMYGGTISDNKAINGGSGGGVSFSAYQGTVFNMYGGTISGNTAVNAGGGISTNGGEFNLYAGSVSGNKADVGGGIYTPSCVVNLRGGEILNNTATSSFGGGIFAQNSANVNVYSGAVSGNTAARYGGGIYFDKGKITLDGKVNINGNTRGGGSADNVYLNGSVVTVGENFDTASVVGIHKSTTSTITCSYSEKMAENVVTDVSAGFTSDTEDAHIEWTDGTLKLMGNHKYSDTYSKDENSHWHLCSICKTAKDGEAAHTGGTATCQNKAACSACGQEYGELAEHTPVDVPAVAATCNEAGKTAGVKCSLCDTVITPQTTVPKLGHSFFDMWTTTSVATCTTEGRKERSCTRAGCTEKETQTIPKVAHLYSAAWQSDDTGHWHKCGNCDAVTDPVRHNWGSGKVTTEPTEDNEGVRTYTCMMCYRTKTEKIDKLEHTHVWSANYEYDDTWHWKVCTKCGEEGTKANHIWDGGIVTKEPDEDTGGVKTYTCTVCSKTRTESIAKTEYTVTLHTNGGTGGTDLTAYAYGTGAVLPADWTKTGYTFDGWYDNESCTGAAVTGISASDTGNKQYWAKWTDNIAPVIGTLTCNYQPKNLWQWLIGKDSLIITVPVTEEGSGADEITYTVMSEDSTAGTQTAAIQDGRAEITVSADFRGTISIVCTDKAGNTSAGVTVGADSGADGIIIEDHAPEITFEAGNAGLVQTGEYKTAPDITVTVKDDKDHAVSGGIASVSCKIGDGSEETVDHDYTAGMVVNDSFTIPAGEIPAGETVISVTATDHAGNSNTQNYTVKVHTHSGTLVPAKPAACTEGGHEAYYTCTCGKWYSDSGCTTEVTEQDVVTAVLGHDFSGDWQQDEKHHWKKCVRCEEAQTKEEHMYDNDTDRDCSVCGYERIIHREMGTVSKDVEKDEKAPDTTLSTSKEELADIILTEDEKAQAENGTDIKFLLNVKDAGDSVNSGDKAAVQEALSGNSEVKGFAVGQYLDISLFKIIGENRSAVSETSRKLTIVIDVPDSLKGKEGGTPRTYAIIRVHDGVAEILPDLDDDANTITIATDRFSSYAVVYQEAGGTAEVTPTPTPTPSGDVKPSSTPGGDIKPSPTPSGDDKPTPTPGGDDKPTPTPDGGDKPSSTPMPEGTVKPTSTPGRVDRVTQTPSPAGTTTKPSAEPGTPTPVPGGEKGKLSDKRRSELHSGLKAVQTGKELQIAWGRVDGAGGYSVYVQYCGKDFGARPLNQVRSGKKTEITVKRINGRKLDTAKNFKMYVAAWRWKDGKKITLAKTLIIHIAGKDSVEYTNIRSIRVKKTSYTLKIGAAVTLRPAAVLYDKRKKQLSAAHTKEFRYLSSDKKVAAVTAGGTVTAKGPGSCTVYVFAKNGCKRKLKIKVRK